MKLPLPAIVARGTESFFIVGKMSDEGALVQDPAELDDLGRCFASCRRRINIAACSAKRCWLILPAAF